MRMVHFVSSGGNPVYVNPDNVLYIQKSEGNETSIFFADGHYIDVNKTITEVRVTLEETHEPENPGFILKD